MAHEELIREGEKFANRRSYCWSAGKVLVRRFVAALESSGRESASLRARVAG